MDTVEGQASPAAPGSHAAPGQQLPCSWQQLEAIWEATGPWLPPPPLTIPGCYQLASPRDVAQTRAQPGTEGQALLWNAWSQDQEQSGTCTPAPSPLPLVNYPAGGWSTARAPGILKASGQQAAWNLPP